MFCSLCFTFKVPVFLYLCTALTSKILFNCRSLQPLHNLRSLGSRPLGHLRLLRPLALTSNTRLLSMEIPPYFQGSSAIRCSMKLSLTPLRSRALHSHLAASLFGTGNKPHKAKRLLDGIIEALAENPRYMERRGEGLTPSSQVMTAFVSQTVG